MDGSRLADPIISLATASRSRVTSHLAVNVVTSRLADADRIPRHHVRCGGRDIVFLGGRLPDSRILQHGTDVPALDQIGNSSTADALRTPPRPPRNFATREALLLQLHPNDHEHETRLVATAMATITDSCGGSAGAGSGACSLTVKKRRLIAAPTTSRASRSICGLTRRPARVTTAMLMSKTMRLS